MTSLCRSRGLHLLLFISHYVLLFLFFFFQAEDGIRDLTVTGVQTCALPISPSYTLMNACPFTVTVSVRVATSHGVPPSTKVDTWVCVVVEVRPLGNLTVADRKSVV